MRTAFIHANSHHLGFDDQVLDCLRHLWPSAHVHLVPDTTAAHPTLPMIDRTPVQPPRGHAHPPADCDVVISTSAAAASSVTVPASVPHICYTGATGTRWLPGVHYIATTHAVAERVERTTGQKCPIVPPPLEVAYFHPASDHREDYYLIVDRDNQPGSCELAIHACGLIGRQLLIASPGQSRVPPYSPARPLNHVHWAVAQPKDALRAHYRRCRALVSLGGSEFDRSVVEAQACGAPVVAYSRSECPEAVVDAEGDGPGTGYFFQEWTAYSLAAAMQELERRPNKCEPALALAQAARFSTSRFEAEMRRIVESIVNGHEQDAGWKRPPQLHRPAA